MTAGPTVRREDVPLHEDVRWLAASLGKVIQRLEGQAAFESVESLRQACRARRYDMADASTLDALLEQVSALPIERAAIVARAFTLFFLLINTAEQVHRVRRTRAYRSAETDSPQPGGARWAMRTLRTEGHDAAAVERADVSSESIRFYPPRRCARAGTGRNPLRGGRDVDRSGFSKRRIEPLNDRGFGGEVFIRLTSVKHARTGLTGASYLGTDRDVAPG